MFSPYFLDGKRILITGGTGTFGRAFVARLLAIPEIKKIIVFSRDEFKQHEMQQQYPNEPRLRFFLGDIRDRDRLQRAFQGVDIIVHAAALKQVPAIEYNPLEAVKTNILGTQNVIDAALDNDVEKVLLISSDKAVHPVNLYGATKLCAERIIIGANAYRGEKGTQFSVVRYGNVWGSRGSLVELIAKQKPKGIVTLTDERMTRFWIKVETVMNIIVDVLACMQGGEIFVPKMKSIRIADMVAMLASECKVEIIGVRPGEKLHEMLIADHEVRRTKDAGDFFVILPEFISYAVHYKWDEKSYVPEQFLYISNHPDFLLSPEESRRVLRLFTK